MRPNSSGIMQSHCMMPEDRSVSGGLVCLVQQVLPLSEAVTAMPVDAV